MGVVQEALFPTSASFIDPIGGADWQDSITGFIAIGQVRNPTNPQAKLFLHASESFDLVNAALHRRVHSSCEFSPNVGNSVSNP